jgi:Chalcone isomerase-like
MIKVYVVGLYLEQKSSDPDAIVQAYAPKQIVMQFLHGVSKGRIANAFDDSFNDECSQPMNFWPLRGIPQFLQITDSVGLAVSKPIWSLICNRYFRAFAC